jgi:hypothetical protein
MILLSMIVTASAIYSGMQYVKPVSFNAPRANKLTNVVVSPKLDGVRALVSMGSDGVFADVAGETRKVSDAIFSTRTVIDCELFDGIYHAFDVLISDGVDVQNLTFKERRSLIPKDLEGVQVKPFYTFEDTEKEFLRSILASSHTDGLIVQDDMKPYGISPLKFKTKITVDLCLRSHKDGHVLLDFEGNVMRQQDGAHQIVHLTEKQLSDMKGHNVIVECTRSVKKFVVLKRRRDRKRPNRAVVVKDNIELVDSKQNTEAFLFRSIPPASMERNFAAYLETLRFSCLVDKHDHYLDVGCATLEYMWIFGHGKVTGIETKSRLVDIARATGKIETKCISFENFCGQANAVTLFFVLHNLDVGCVLAKLDDMSARSVQGVFDTTKFSNFPELRRRLLVSKWSETAVKRPPPPTYFGFTRQSDMLVDRFQCFSFHRV